MSNKYSLRVELDDSTVKKLKRLSSLKAQPMADWVRSQILEASEALPDVGMITKQYPRVIGKLLFWTKKRLAQTSSHSFWDTDKEALHQAALNFVHAVVSELIFAENRSTLEVKIKEYDRILSHQEKACIADFFPFCLKLEPGERLDWFQSGDWYNLKDGEYITLKEQVLREFIYEGEEVGFVSENSYLADILNSPNMMIVDVDLVGDSLLPTDPVVTPYQSVAISALKAFQSENPALGFRVYKTAGGLRYICTTEMFDAANAKSDFIMRQLYADPKYRNLCKFQETYRARLTPKPWRLRFGDENDFRTCKMLEIVGPSHIIDNFYEMVGSHDSRTNAFSKEDLPLA